MTLRGAGLGAARLARPGRRRRSMPPGFARPGSMPPLRLRAEDAEDLAVLSACLQDALVAVRDLAYDPGAGVFVLVANRFRWENCHSGAKDGPSSARFAP